MTKSAMNNNMRTKPFMTNAAIKKEAYKAGYKYTGYSTWECEACKDEMELAIQAVGYTGTKPAWANAHIALKFHKKGSTVVACKCGWRKDVTINFTAVSKSVCKVRGCNHILNKADTDGLCVPCRNEIAGGGNPAKYSKSCALKPKGGCMFYLQEGQPGCIRIGCKDFNNSTASTSTTNICHRKGCNNPLPKGRNAVCYDCRKPSKKEAANNFPM